MEKSKQGKKSNLDRILVVGRYLAGTPLPEILFVYTLILARWWRNSDFSYPSEVTIPLIIFTVVTTIIYYTYRLILKEPFAVHIAALLLSFSFYRYDSIQHNRPGSWLYNLLPDKWTTLTSSLVMAAALLVICGLIGWSAARLVKRYEILQQLELYRVLMFAIGFIFVVQLGRVGLRYTQIYNELQYQYPAITTTKTIASSVGRPDIYYLVFDRYGNTETLKNIYGYDNSDLLNYLGKQGFVTRDSAYANYPFTMSSVASTLAMDYFPQFESMFSGDSNWQSAYPYRSILNNSPVSLLLKANGYETSQVSSWWDFTRIGISADHHPGQAFRLKAFGGRWYLSDLQRDVVNTSILAPWLKIGIGSVLKYDLALNPKENLETQISSLKAIASRSDKSAPQFAFAHILVPHEPYLFNPDGSDSSYDVNRNDWGADEKVKYTNQVSYINKRIKELVGSIRKNSPNAAIVIQADEGPYPKEFRFELTRDHYYNPADLPLAQMKQKFSILASYYLPGLPLDEVKKINSSVNIFRFVLSRYLGYDLPPLPDCHLATGDKFNVYTYQLVNDKLEGFTPAGCQQYE